jgi:Transglutaminase-like superfamily
MGLYLTAHDVLYAAGMRWVLRVLGWMPRGDMPPPSHVIARAVRGQEIASALYVKPVKCLQRAVVTTMYLRRRGYACDLVVGAHVARKEGHAWVEAGDIVLGDPRFFRRHFRPLMRA